MKLFRILLIPCALLVLALILIAAWFLGVNKTNGAIESSGVRRTFLLYVPESYQPDEPTPLVISLHGFAEWPAHQRDISGWNRLADKHGFIVVYPSGTGFPLRWNAHGIQGEADDSMVDVVFISDLIDELSMTYTIDSTRIYANGLSNGAGMSYMLACTLANRIAAIGGVAGAYSFPQKDCHPSRPVPVIVFHGTGDKIVPYEGGDTSHRGFLFPAIRDYARNWAVHNGCEAGPLELFSQGEVQGIRYTDCSQDAEVHFYTIQGGGHSWPGGEPMPEFIVGHTSQDIDATEIMWDFFDVYTLGE